MTASNGGLKTTSFEQCIARDFLPIVTLLRLFGGYPMKIVRMPAKQSPKMEKLRIIGFPSGEQTTMKVTLYEQGSAKDWVTWYSLLMSGFLISSITAMALIMGLERGTEPDNVWIQKKHSSAEEFGMTNRNNEYLFICVLILSVLLILTILCRSSKFTEWINGWDEFEIILSKIGMEPPEISGYFRPKSSLVIYWALGLVVTASIALYFSVNLHYDVIPSLSVFFYVVNGGVYGALFMPAVSEDVRAHHMLRMLRSAFQMVRRTFAIEVPGTVTMATVERGRTLTDLVRRQVALAGDCLQGWLSLLVINALLTMSFGMYIALDFHRNGKSMMAQNGFLIFTSSFCSLPLLRLYLEVQVAERIYEEERRLCQDILQIRDRTESSLVKSELQFLHQRLQAKPAMISVGNYFVLDKKLLINVLIQVLTLLIAITQFGG